jgi:hypothetical protein
MVFFVINFSRFKLAKTISPGMFRQISSGIDRSEIAFNRSKMETKGRDKPDAIRQRGAIFTDQ